MAKQKKERGGVVSIDIINDNVCKECKAKHEATKTTYENGDVVISPMRCKSCQTAHLTNLRVNKTIKDISLLGNLKARLSKVECDAILEAISGAFNVLVDRYSGSTVKTSAFDLRKVKVQ